MSSYGQISLLSSMASGFCASSAFTTPAAATTDFWEIYGNSTRIIEIKRIAIAFSCAGVGATTIPKCFLLRRTTANSGGTATTETNVPLNTVNGSSLAVVKTYTANPTVGSSGGRVNSVILAPVNNATSAQTTTSYGSTILFDARDFTTEPLILRSANEGIVVNFNGVIPDGTTPLLAVSAFWTERDA